MASDVSYTMSEFRLAEIRGFLAPAAEQAGHLTVPAIGVTRYELAAAVEDLLADRDSSSEAQHGCAEAVDLLALWFSRFQGFTAGTPDGMVVRTRRVLTENGKPPRDSRAVVR